MRGLKAILENARVHTGQGYHQKHTKDKGHGKKRARTDAVGRLVGAVDYESGGGGHI